MMLSESPGRTYSALGRWLLSSLNRSGLRPRPLVFALRHHTSYYFTSATTSVARDGVSSLSAYAIHAQLRRIYIVTVLELVSVALRGIDQ
jgi:hypothetical protein